MEFRRADEADIQSIMYIIRRAQDYFRAQGINQWQNNYPNTETIISDIRNGYSHVLLKENIVVGTAAVSFDGEKTYDMIEGKWISDDKYAVIHRIAVHPDYKGLGFASVMVESVKKMCLDRNVFSIKIDTHEDNKPMQKLLQKNGFQYCGVIYLENGSKRLAYEKVFR